MTDTDARHALLARLIDHAPMFPPASLGPCRGARRGRAGCCQPRMRSCSRDSCGRRRGSGSFRRPIGRSALFSTRRFRPASASKRSRPRLSSIRPPAMPPFPGVRCTSRRRSTVASRIGSTTSPSTGCARRSGAAALPCPASTRSPASSVPAASAGSSSRRRRASITRCARTGSTASSTCLRRPPSPVRRRRALAEDDPSAFALDNGSFAWRDRSASAEELAGVRRDVLHSIGSCSFFEPVDELASLGMLPSMKGAVGFGVFSVGGDAPRVGFRVGGGNPRPRRGRSRRGVRGVDAQPVPRARPLLLGGHARARRRARVGRRRSRSSRRGPRASALRRGRLRRLLLVDRARDEPRAPLPSGRRAAPAELAPPSRRLPRACRNGRRQRNARRASVRPDEAANRGRAPLRAEQAAGHRARARASSWVSAARSASPSRPLRFASTSSESRS